MKTFRAKNGPFNERPFYTDHEIENMCSGELQALGLYPETPGPIRIDRFIEKRFVVPKYEYLDSGILGLTIFGKTGVREIIVARSLDEEGSTTARRRIRTTLAHEGGHGLFHSHLFALDSQAKPLFGDFGDPDAPKVLCREQTKYRGEWWEFQANKAIGALLMPRTLTEEALEDFLIPRGLLGFVSMDFDRFDDAVAHLTETFDVNPIVAKIRLSELFRSRDKNQLTL